MARAYRDGVELVTEPLPFPSAVLPPDAVLVRGVSTFGTEPMSVVLVPGFEYRTRCVVMEGERVWIMERRRVGNHDNGDT